MGSIEQTQFLARNYPHLQGMRVLPTALLLLGITLWANLQAGPARDLTFPILFALACLGLYILVARYYNRIYGRVRRATSRAELLFQGIAGSLALAAFIIDDLTAVNISVLGLIFALAFAFTAFLYWRPAKILFTLYLALAAVLASLSILPLLGSPEWWNLLGFKHSLLAFTFLYGVFGLVSGIVAHIYFVRSLPAPPEAS